MPRWTPTILFTLITVIALSAAMSAQTPVPADFLVKLVRGTCEGSCPGYTLTLDSKGKVTWDGRFFVQQKGLATKTIARRGLDSIVRKIEEMRFFNFQKGERLCTDTPDVLVEITMTRKVKSSKHDSCSQEKTAEGQQVAELARHIEKVAGIEQWVGSKPSR